MKPIIEERFPANKILDGELLLGYDNKLRYPYNIRHAVYRYMFDRLRSYAKRTELYLCMEEERLWRELGLINKNT